MLASVMEQSRVARHIERAVVNARRSRPPRDRVKALVRALLLGELARYRRRGVFPKNRDFPERAMPYFVDADGTRCAVAHLLEVGGQAALVAKIARERNNAFVRELADEPELLAWLDAAGMSVEEAAAIQPTYCDVPAASICGGAFQTRVVNAAGVAEVRPEGVGMGTVVAIYGDGAGLNVGDKVLANGQRGNEKLLLVAISRDGFKRTQASPKSTLPAGMPMLGAGIAIDTNGILQDSGEHPLTREQVVAAVSKPTQADCREHVASIDEWYAEDDDECRDATTVSACSFHGGGASSAASIGILIAVVSAIVSRRTSRRRR
jgi:hypothetical protein